MSSAAYFPAHPKPPAGIVSRCVVKGCDELVAVEQAFCERHDRMMPLDHAKDIFLAWEDFLLQARQLKTTEAHAALHRWCEAQRHARRSIEAREAKEA